MPSQILHTLFGEDVLFRIFTGTWVPGSARRLIKPWKRYEAFTGLREKHDITVGFVTAGDILDSMGYGKQRLFTEVSRALKNRTGAVRRCFILR
jgi:hypothetical protein